MSDSVADWLEQLGLGQYARAFDDNAIAFEHLAELDHETLKEIGVRAVGHRMTILKAAMRSAEASSDGSVRESAETSSASTARPKSRAELRQLSVMFCDLVGSTALSERLDLEQYRELLGTYQDAARSAIEGYGGYIARYMGDGLLVYFGYPTASEDDAERAVRAGLAVVERVRALPVCDGIELQVRVGIATGRVVAGDIVGEGVSEEHAVLGETPNLAARLQGLATPNRVVISETTKHLVEGRFDLAALDPQRVKGIRDPVRPYEATAIRTTSRFEASTAGGMSDFVGRHGELRLLVERWTQAKSGHGQVVLLSGEAGIGKSRLLRELREHAADVAHEALRFQCSPYASQTAFSPFIEQLQRDAGFTQDDSVSEKLDKVEHLVSPAVEDPSSSAPLLAALLSLPGERYPPLDMTPQRQKLENITALVSRVEGLARNRPVLMLVEDLHWADASTLEALDSIIARAQFLPVLMVNTHRPEFASPWSRFGHVSQYSLNRLDRRAATSLIVAITGGRALPDTVLDHILEHTDGVPLFVEELTKAVIEAGFLREEKERYVLDGPLPSLAIPATLQDSLMARLDRLAEVREVAQAAACIGREFTTALLTTVLERPSLEENLEQLVEAGLIFSRGANDRDTYIFKHALVQDAAYESLLVSRRQALHARIARVMESEPDVDPGILSRHFAAAGLAEAAASYALAAGRRALSVSALPEAVSELETGLQQIDALPSSSDADRLELELRTTLGASRLAYYGWPHPSVVAAYEPAFALANKLEDEAALGPILWGLCVHYWTRAEFSPTHRWLTRLEDISDVSAQSELSVVRDMTAGCQYFWEAEYDRAWGYTTRIRRTYDERRHTRIAAYTNHDPLCFSPPWAGSLLQWIIGFPARARELAEEAHVLARRIGHPFNSVFALTAGSEGLLMCGDTEHVLSCCDEAQEIVDSEGLGDFAQHVLVDNWRGRAHTRMGDFETGYRLTKLATTRWREAEGRICSALFWGGEAMALAGLGRLSEARELIGAAVDHCRDTGDRYMEPEVLRLKAELMLATDGIDARAAEALLRQALQIACDHGAKSWSLRVATSLARSMSGRGQPRDARELLAPIYEWFSEGSTSTDIRQAKTLLEDLS
jgi:class 3 adenylate cyclase